MTKTKTRGDLLVTILIAIILALFITFIFDYTMFRIEQEREIEASWKKLNNKLEQEGKQRWDKR